MSNDFWIAATAAVIIGGIWLYKKGKRTYSFIRKMHRSFKGVCLDSKSTLTKEQCKKIAVGAMYASQQSLSELVEDRHPRLAASDFGRVVGH